MSNPSKQKGTAAETALVNWARLNGYPDARRQPLSGAKDIGDVWLEPSVVVEVKNHASWTDLDIDRWLAEAERERINAGADHCLLVVKRPGKASPANWWFFHRHSSGVVGQFRLGQYLHYWRGLNAF